jgi:hypothetical protein
MTEEEIEKQIRFELNQARVRNPLVKEWAPDEIEKLKRGRILRERALADLRNGLARDQGVLDQFADAKQVPTLIPIPR